MDLNTFNEKCPPGLACKGIASHWKYPYITHRKGDPKEETPIFFYTLTDGPTKEHWISVWRPDTPVNVVSYVHQNTVQLCIVPEFLARFPELSHVRPITLDQFLAVANLVGTQAK